MTRAALLSAFLVALSAMALQGCGGITYSAKEIDAQVVDAQSHQPLQGVNVVAHWRLVYGIEGGRQTDIVLMETVTDNEGRFYFPAWGPKRVEPVSWPTYVDSGNPELIVFKSGYAFRALTNELRGPDEFKSGVSASDWHGRIIELRKFEGSSDNYGSIVASILTGVSFGRCRWTHIPRMLKTVNDEQVRLQEQGIRNAGEPIFQEIERNLTDGCGSVRQFIKDYEQ